MTKTIKIDLPAGILTALNENENELSQDMRLFSAIAFFQKAKLTIGKAAQFAGLTRFEFEKSLKKHNVSASNLTINDIQKELEVIENI